MEFTEWKVKNDQLQHLTEDANADTVYDLTSWIENGELVPVDPALEAQHEI
jgi:hypothetical protein